MLQRAIHTHIYDFLFIIVFTQAKMNAHLWEYEYSYNYVKYLIYDTSMRYVQENITKYFGLNKYIVQGMINE